MNESDFLERRQHVWALWIEYLDGHYRASFKTDRHIVIVSPGRWTRSGASLSFEEQYT